MGLENGHRLLLLAVCACLSGCNGTGLGPFLRDETALLEFGPPARMTPAAVQQEKNKQIPLLYEFAALGGIPIGNAPDVASQQFALTRIDPAYWQTITLAGENYIDTQCDAFISALYTLDKNRKASLTNLNSIQSATVGLMGLTQAAQTAIGIVGISFGLASHLFDTTISSVLYQLPPVAVASVVKAERTLLRDEEKDKDAWASLTTQPAAVQRLRRYVLYCAPVTIEEKITVLLSNTEFDAVTNKLISAAPPSQSTTPPPAPQPRPPAPPENVAATVPPAIPHLPIEAPVVLPPTVSSPPVAPRVDTTVNPRPHARGVPDRTVHRGPLPDKVHTKLVELIKFVRNATPQQLADVKKKLNLTPTSDIGAVRRALSNRVTDPTRAEEQMQQLSNLLQPVLGRTFWP